MSLTYAFLNKSIFRRIKMITSANTSPPLRDNDNSVSQEQVVPLFIVGAGRSGSTLLRMMLISHSRICIPPETWYLMQLLQRFDTRAPLSPKELQSVVTIMTGHYRWPDMRIRDSELLEMTSKLDKPRLRDVVESVYLWHMNREKKARWGDKSPPYVAIVPQLALLFPGAKFIHLVRDGHDVAASFHKQRWYGPWLHANSKEWISAANYDYDWSRNRVDAQVIRARYEDLVLDTERTLRRICEFIGEEFEPEMLSWQEHVDSSVPNRELSIHHKLKKPPSADDTHRWKREMSNRQIWITEAFMGSQLTKMGYERKFRSSLLNPAMFVTRTFCQIVLPTVDLIWRTLGRFRKALNKSHEVKQ